MVDYYLHIGLNKAGSTSIQKHLAANYPSLLRNGVLYPKLGRHVSFSDKLGFAMSPKNIPKETEFNEFREEFFQEINHFRPKKVVLSSEYFIREREMTLTQKFFKGQNVKVILFLRRHDHYWISLYTQAIKTVTNPPWSRHFATYYDFHMQKNPNYFSFKGLTERWATVFGAEKIVVIPFEKEQLTPSLIGRFYSAIGEPGLERTIAASHERFNEALDEMTLSRIDYLQRTMNDDAKRRQLIAKLMNNADPGGKKLDLTPDERLFLIEPHLDEYDWIAKKYLGRQDGTLFFEALPVSQSPIEKLTYTLPPIEEE